MMCLNCGKMENWLNINDDSSLDNYFFVTSKCNSNCVMCPSPDLFRKSGETQGLKR